MSQPPAPYIPAQGSTYKDVGGHFDRMAGQYKAGSAKVGWIGHTALFDTIRKHAQGPNFTPRILDLGTGNGELGELFKARHDDAFVVGVDLSQNMLELARQGGHIDVAIHGSATDLSNFANNSFDHVTCAGVLDFIEDTATFASEVSRVLKPGGLFGFTYEPLGTQNPGVKTFKHDPGTLRLQFAEHNSRLLETTAVTPVYRNFRTGEDVENHVVIGQHL